MIVKRIVDSEQLSDIDIQLVKHGIDIILCDTSGMLGILVQSLYFHTTLETLIYILVFSCLRIHSGGIHAKKKITCFLTTQMIYLMFVLSYKYFHFNDLFQTVIVFCSFTYTWINAPAIHPLQPLTSEEAKENQLKCQLILILIFICYIFISTYRYIFTYILFINTMMMLLLRLQEKRIQDGN